MTKKKYFKYKFYCNSAYYASLIAMLVVGMIVGRRILPTTRNTPIKNQEAQQTEVVPVDVDTVKTITVPTPPMPKAQIMPITKDNDTSRLRHKIDSLSAANMAMFDSVAERYSAKLDSRYTLDRFFNKSEITQLNEIMVRFLNDSLASDTLLNTAKEMLPLTRKTPLVTFEALISITNVSEQDLAKFGIVFDSEHIDYFTDNTRQKVLEQYLRAYTKVSTAAGEPNFVVPEIASIRQKYDANLRQIDNLRNQIKEKSGH